MVDIILGLTLLFNPFGYQTPVHGIEVMHFGHQVPLATVDAAWDRAAAPWKGDPYWGWMPEMIPQFTRVMVAPLYYRMNDCQHQVQWAVVASVDRQLGYTIIVNPELLGSQAFDDSLETAFSKELQIMSFKAAPMLRAMGGCSQ